MRSSSSRALRFLTILAVCGAALVILASPADASPRHAIRIHVNTPVILPDGQTAPAGTLTLRLERDLTPVRGLHTIEASGFVGEFATSRISSSELEGVDTSFVLFYAAPNGSLRLIGYTWSDGHRAHAYLLAADAYAERFLAETRHRGKAPLDREIVILSAAANGG